MNPFLFAFCFKGPRSILNSHALVSSIATEMNEEIVLQFISTVDFRKQFSDLIEMHTNMNIVLVQSLSISCLAYFSWTSYKYFNEQKMNKFNSILLYKENRKKIRLFISVVAFFFLRNVENAI